MCSSSHHPQKNPHRSAKKAILPWAIGIASSLLVIGAGYGYWTNQQNPQLASSYSAEDVVRIKPFRAVHKMGMGPPIPFLPKTKAQPQIKLAENFYDFGSVGPKEIARKTFVVRNTGKEALTISRAYTTCGCTIAEFSSSVIPPGKVALVTVIFDAGFHDTRGQTVKRGVVIENNDPNRSRAEIWIKASVRQS